MSGFYSARHESERREQMTPERIMRIARQMGMFTVSLRWRDDWLRERCSALKRQGLLTGGKRNGRQLQYFPAAHLASASHSEQPRG